MNFLKWFQTKDDNQSKEYQLVGGSEWSISWKDIGTTERGHWQMYENGRGQRYFEITNKSNWLDKEERHPGYSKLKLWSNGGPWPDSAKRLSKEKLKVYVLIKRTWKGCEETLQVENIYRTEVLAQKSKTDLESKNRVQDCDYLIQEREVLESA